MLCNFGLLYSCRTGLFIANANHVSGFRAYYPLLLLFLFLQSSLKVSIKLELKLIIILTDGSVGY